MKALPVSFVGVLLFSGISELRADDLPSLKEESGPFMVVACHLEGPDVEERARAVAMEIRGEYRLPSYVLRYRHLGREGVLVLVGDSKVMDDAKVIQKQVRSMKIRSLFGTPHEKGLKSALVTINPLMDSSKFACGKPDRTPEGVRLRQQLPPKPELFP